MRPAERIGVYRHTSVSRCYRRSKLCYSSSAYYGHRHRRSSSCTAFIARSDYRGQEDGSCLSRYRCSRRHNMRSCILCGRCGCRVLVYGQQHDDGQHSAYEYCIQTGDSYRSFPYDRSSQKTDGVYRKRKACI